MDALQGAIDVDTNIFFSINRMHNMYFDYFMSAYSGKWVWIPMYAAIWYVMLRNFHWKVTLFCMIGLALTITFADQACATWIRPYVERMRPSNLNNPISEMMHIVNNHREGVMVFLRVMPPIPSDWRFSCSFYSASGGLLFSLWPGRC